MSFLLINKTSRLNNLKTRAARDMRVSVFVICVEAIVYLLSYNLHDCTFNICQQKLEVLTLPGYILHSLTALYFHISIRIFCALFICLVFDGLLQWIYFRMFCSKHPLTLENMYPLSCWFHCVGILYIKFRCCETYIVTSFVTRNLLIKPLSNFRTINCWFSLILHTYVLG